MRREKLQVSYKRERLNIRILIACMVGAHYKEFKAKKRIC